MKIDSVCENRTFLRAYRKGKKYAGKYIVIYCVRTRPDRPCRLGLTVTKGRGSAVVRSRIKRILRASWRDVMTRRTASAGFDVIIVARDSAATAKSTDIAPELKTGLEVLGVLGGGE